MCCSYTRGSSAPLPGRQDHLQAGGAACTRPGPPELEPTRGVGGSAFFREWTRGPKRKWKFSVFGFH